MTKEDVVDCLLIAVSGIEPKKFMTGRMSKKEMKRLVEALRYVGQQNIQIDDSKNK
jgi:replicative DNA helicase